MICLKLQLTAAESWIALNFDSEDTIGSQGLTRNMIGGSGKVKHPESADEAEGDREREREMGAK